MLPTTDRIQKIMDAVQRGGRTYEQIAEDLGGESSDGFQVFIQWHQDMTVAVRNEIPLVFTKDYRQFLYELKMKDGKIMPLIKKICVA